MRYFKNKETEWRYHESGLCEYREWHISHLNPEALLSRLEAVETDAAGNPLGKYRYFRDKQYPSSEWRLGGGGLWEFKLSADGSWGSSHQYTVKKFLEDSTAYECDEAGNRLAGNEEDNKPLNGKPIRPESSPAPMSEWERLRWREAMAGDDGSCG